MITGLDHVAVAVRDFDAAVDGYRRMFGREPELQPGGGARRAWFGLPNMALELISPDADDSTHPVRERLDAAGEGVWLAALQADDMEADAKLLGRRGLDVAPEGDLARVKAAGLDFLLWPARERLTSPATESEAAAVSSMDHLVVHSPNPDRAAGVYGAKFGMDLRLDRENAQWGARQLFFNCGNAVFEVAASLKAPVSTDPDSFGGFAWRVIDAEAARDRIAAAGFNVSEVRIGRKPGTRVFTVRDAPGGVPTLMIQQNAEPN